jgi:hypothetical protein
VRPGGHVIIGTFAPSGLSVLRHDAASIGAVLGDKFALVESRRTLLLHQLAPRKGFSSACFAA